MESPAKVLSRQSSSTVCMSTSVKFHSSKLGGFSNEVLSSGSRRHTKMGGSSQRKEIE